MRDATEQPGPFRVGFVLASGFAELHLDIAAEGLRIANRLSGREVFQTAVYTVGDDPAVASNGRVLRPDAPLARIGRPDAVFVIAGLEPEAAYRSSLVTHLRRLDRRRCLLGAIDTGAVFLAEAGLIKDELVAVHWEYKPTFRRRYPGISTTSRGFVWTDRRLTCSGGLSVGDMMIEFTRRLASGSLAEQLADVLNYERSVGSGALFQTQAPLDIVTRAMALMRENMEDPLSLQELSDALHVHAKTLARGFVKQLGESPIAHYRRLRLERGRDLLMYGRFSVKQAAYASGFSSIAHFCSAFRSAYGYPPGQLKHTA